LINKEDARRIRIELLEMLEEDAHNVQRLLGRLDAITMESGVGAHAALILILTHLQFNDDEAREHWAGIISHRDELGRALGRDVGVRVALLDYFVNVNRHLIRPTLIDLEMFEAGDMSDTRDSLTGLATDKMFRVAVQHELRRARRYGQTVSVILFDLDDFGPVNDRLGRFVGDRMLRELAILLNNKIRDIDIATRPGEDEVALVLPQTDRNGALLVAERFRLEVEQFFGRREADGAPVGLTISGGVATYPGDANSPEELLERAAQALYRAKASGKNLIQVYNPERRRFLRFDLEPGRFEVEVLGSQDLPPGEARNLSRNGIVFTSPEKLHVGEEIEIRLQDQAPDGGPKPLRVRGRVVRLEELPEAEDPKDGGDLFEIGVAFDADSLASGDDLLDFLERSRIGSRQGSE
jgi:diguanylate cyclase (GGDEF)-like protein